jgi:2-polyprenyl-6-methoxyphenol hydroxylase-like FAD-dependent oxidoreductase
MLQDSGRSVTFMPWRRAGRSGVAANRQVLRRGGADPPVLRSAVNQRETTMRSTTVLIVGAGPTGLLLAGDLAAAGVACAVLERRAEESNLTRAFAVHARTLELLDARGLADDLVATGRPIGVLRLFDRATVDLSRLPTRFPFLLVTPQYHTERLLGERAAALGAELVDGAEVIGLRQDADGVEVEVRAEGRVHRRHAAHVVGADGVHSTVRQALGLPFPGHGAVRSVMLADVRLDRAPPEILTVNAVGDGFAFIVPFGDGWYRVIAWDRRRQLPDSAPVDQDELRDITRRTLGTDFGMHRARWLSRFHSDERQVPHYRVGRVFLAGDAAHVHSPAGGLGMNTGLQDAANLGWKLAAASNGWAPDGLLDSYHSERYPVGQDVLRTSGTLLRLALLRPWPLRVARGMIGAVATRIGPLADRAAGRLSGIAVRYPAPAGAHRLAGERAPDLRLANADRGPGRLYEVLRGGRFVLLARAQDHAVAAAGWPRRLVLATTADATRTTILVRPDGYVAWAADQPSRADLTAALTGWCGQPTRTQPDRAGAR